MATFIPSDAPYIQREIPPDYAASLEQLAPNINSLVESTQGPNESWVDSLARLLPVVASTYQQKQLLDTQVQRARAGLPPLDVTQYAPGFQVGLSADTQRLMMWGGVGLVAVVWMMSRKR